MKSFSNLICNAFIACFIVLMFTSCVKDKLTKTYTIYTPVYKTRQEVLASVKNGPAQTVNTPGKIYLYDRYIFLNEFNKGVHIIDNSDPTAPKTKAFINIPGNIDIAVKGNILYADMFADLLTIDISDPLNSRLVKSIPKVFPERQYGLTFSPDTSKIIVDWVSKDTTIDIATNQGQFPCFNCVFDYSAVSGLSNSSSNGGGGAGAGGSMARFAIVGEYLYTVGAMDLSSFSIANPFDPRFETKSAVGMDIETIFPFKQKLFIGSASGMFIYSIANAASPVRESSFQHARACDPVIADDNYAYVTLRTGTWCGGNTNTLDVVDISNITSPKLVKTYQLKNPHGLSKDQDLLFVCDGSDGLKMYNTKDVNKLELLQHIKGFNTYDAIAHNKILLVVSDAGINQYDYKSGDKLQLLSTIRINRKS